MTPGFAGGFGYDLPGYTIADELAGLMALSETPYDQVKPHIKAVLKYLVGFCQACGEEYDDTSRLMLHHDHGTGACVATGGRALWYSLSACGSHGWGGDFG